MTNIKDQSLDYDQLHHCRPDRPESLDGDSDDDDHNHPVNILDFQI